MSHAVYNSLYAHLGFNRGCCAVFTVAVLAGVSRAQPSGTSNLILEASTDGVTWQSTLLLDVIGSPGGRDVQFRVRAQLLNATGVIGFGGVTYQTTIDNWGFFGDRTVPFSTADGSGGPNTPSFIGRINPFASVGQGPGSASGTLTQFVEGTTVRFGGANSTPFGNPAFGVNSSQLTQQLGGTNFSTSLDVVIFKFATHIGNRPTSSLNVTIPPSTVYNNRMIWYTSPDGSNSYLAPVASTFPARIVIIPGPGTACVAAAGLCLQVRRRR